MILCNFATRPDVQTICMGLAASIASFILVGGEITKRIAFPHACLPMNFFYFRKKILCLRPRKYELVKVMIHQPASSFYEAQTGEVILEAEELLKLQ
uniref:ATP-dependent Clp protease proteolytic subunit n=1 Tax=Brassica oleracea TaxID=3712 RepID=A0A3P6G4V2_BRAOL|nr:unnamed protein product [Brassica oleracea]